MTSSLRIRCTISITALSAAVLATVLTTGPTERAVWAQPKPRPACGLTTLPLVEGNEWVYKAVSLEKDPEIEAQHAKQARPKQPAELRIKVTGVKVEGPNAEITLQETAKDLFDITTVLKCTRDQLTVSPESFLFMGEPGGGTGIKIENLEQPGPSYQFRFGRPVLGGTNTETIKADMIREPGKGTDVKLTPAKLDLQRNVTVGGVTEEITTQMGTFKALQLRVELFGVVKIEAPDPGEPPTELPVPANTMSDLWFAPGVGLVQVRNRYFHSYQLVDAKLN